MKVVLTDSFFKSLKVMVRHQTWWYKTYEVFRYKIPMFFENLWFFRKQLWEFRSWDYSFNLRLLSRSLEKTSDTINRYGNESDESRLKKIEKINRVIELINNLSESSYILRAEKELGEIRGSDWFSDDEEMNPEDMEHNRRVYGRASEIEEGEWNEIWDILRGQNINEYRTLMDSLDPSEKDKMDVYNRWFDGSGMRGWWD